MSGDRGHVLIDETVEAGAITIICFGRRSVRTFCDCTKETQQQNGRQNYSIANHIPPVGPFLIPNVRRNLYQKGCEVATVSSGGEVKPDIYLWEQLMAMSVLLEKMSGCATAKAAIRRFRRTAFVSNSAYYDKKDLANFYTYSDKGLSLFPDDVHLLALSGWVIPRAFTPDEPDADKKLDKAEVYEKHALDGMSTMTKPSVFTDEQFTQFKTGERAVP